MCCVNEERANKLETAYNKKCDTELERIARLIGRCKVKVKIKWTKASLLDGSGEGFKKMKVIMKRK